MSWTEKADDYSAPRRASASVCQKTKIPARRPAESSIIAYFSQLRHSAALPSPGITAENHEKCCFGGRFGRYFDLSYSQQQGRR
jgi:hypothetical protein